MPIRNNSEYKSAIGQRVFTKGQTVAVVQVDRRDPETQAPRTFRVREFTVNAIGLSEVVGRKHKVRDHLRVTSPTGNIFGLWLEHYGTKGRFSDRVCGLWPNVSDAQSAVTERQAELRRLEERRAMRATA